MDYLVTRESVLERVRNLPEHLLEEADLLLAELMPITDEEWLKILSEAPEDDEPLSLGDVIALNREHEKRAARRREREQEQRHAI